MENVQTIEGLGKCHVCGMTGILMARPKFSAGMQDTSDTIPMEWACAGCRETPIGIKSDNQNHKRLPEEEYLIK